MQTILEEYNNVLSKRIYRECDKVDEFRRINLATTGLRLMGVEFTVTGAAGSQRITITAAPIAAIPAIEDLLWGLATTGSKATEVLAVVNAVLASGQRQATGPSPANGIARAFAIRYGLTYNEAAITSANSAALMNIVSQWLVPMTRADPSGARSIWVDGERELVNIEAFNTLLGVLKYYRDEHRTIDGPDYYSLYQELQQRCERVKQAMQ